MYKSCDDCMFRQGEWRDGGFCYFHLLPQLSTCVHFDRAKLSVTTETIPLTVNGDSIQALAQLDAAREGKR